MPSASGLTRKIYDRAPIPLRRAVSLVPFGWRVGRVYRSTLDFLKGSDRWDEARLKAYQTRCLSQVFASALRNVPYYREHYAALLGRDPWEILRNIEPVTKRKIQEDVGRFLDRTLPTWKTYTTSTGGTTGQPLQIVLDRVGFQIEWAFMVAQWLRVGYVPGMRKATFRGVPFEGGRLWQENPVYDELQFSPFAMSQRNLSLYVGQIRDYEPDYLYGYPSALTILAKYVEAHPDSGFPKVRGVLSGSETLLGGQREYLEKAFGARVFSWYGMSEKVILAGECEYSASYHAFPQYGVTEVRDRRGNVTSEPGAEGELVGTGFTNRAMPFIRYLTGDYARIQGVQCPSCGRHFLVLEDVRGRWIQEMVIGKDEEPISLTALNMHEETFKDIRQFQFHQRAVGEVTLRVVPARGYDGAAKERIRKALDAKTGQGVDWRIEEVSSIPLSPRGKGIFLVQELSGALFNANGFSSNRSQTDGR